MINKVSKKYKKNEAKQKKRKKNNLLLIFFISCNLLRENESLTQKEVNTFYVVSACIDIKLYQYIDILLNEHERQIKNKKNEITYAQQQQKQ